MSSETAARPYGVFQWPDLSVQVRGCVLGKDDEQVAHGDAGVDCDRLTVILDP